MDQLVSLAEALNGPSDLLFCCLYYFFCLFILILNKRLQLTTRISKISRVKMLMMTSAEIVEDRPVFTSRLLNCNVFKYLIPVQ